MGSTTVETKTSLGVLLHTYRTLTYKWRHAIGEMIDNSVDSYLENKEQLENGLDIWINYDGKDRTLSIKDNAYGMNAERMADAVQITRRHGGNYFSGGIGHYGLGLKKSATSLGDEWTVISKQKNSKTKYTVLVDVLKLYKEDANSVEILDQPSNTKHGTRIEIKLRKIMRGALEKNVKAHIAEMYRFYLEEGDVRIWWNDELLEYDQPATYIGDDNEAAWTTITLDVKTHGSNKTVKVSGEIYVLETMSHAYSGLRLYHTNRMIQGGGGKPNENWRPHDLVGGAEGYRARRFCGHLHLDHLGVNHQKDDFIWDKFDKDDLLNALQKSQLVGDYLKIAGKKVKSQDGDNPSTANVARNIKKGLGSKSVESTVSEERDTKKLKALHLTKDEIEQMVEQSGETIKLDSDLPKASISFIENPYGPFMTSEVTRQIEGQDQLRILINEQHEYFEQAIESEAEKELWIQFVYGLALTKYTLTGTSLTFEKIIETMGKMLKSFRISDD